MIEIIPNDTDQKPEAAPVEIEGQTTTLPPIAEDENGKDDDEARQQVRTARELIPVGPTGVAPMNLAQQVDFAKTMIRAVNTLPQHLRDNVGDCLALVDIATRANMSPYMLAAKTYVQNGRLCFESMAYHALAQSSGLLDGDLSVVWHGKGDAMICVVTGKLKGDPEIKELRSEPLKDLHPGHVEKNGKKFCKGSPLWDRKPRVQMFYDTARDWVRIYAPRATLGIYTPDEIQEYSEHFGPDRAKEIAAKPGLRERLATNGDQTGEGHDAKKVDTELANLGGGKQTVILPAEKTEPRRRLRRRKDTATPTKPAKPEKSAKPPKADPPKPEEPKPVDQDPAGPPAEPKTAAEYIAHAEAWIARCKDRDEAEARWEGDDEMRNALSVPVKERIRLRKVINDKFTPKE